MEMLSKLGLSKNDFAGYARKLADRACAASATWSSDRYGIVFDPDDFMRCSAIMTLHDRYKPDEKRTYESGTFLSHISVDSRDMPYIHLMSRLPGRRVETFWVNALGEKETHIMHPGSVARGPADPGDLVPPQGLSHLWDTMHLSVERHFLKYGQPNREQIATTLQNITLAHQRRTLVLGGLHLT